MTLDVLMKHIKELDCLYLIDEALAMIPYPNVLQKVTGIAPVSFRYLNACVVTIGLDGCLYTSKPLLKTQMSSKSLLS